MEFKINVGAILLGKLCMTANYTYKSVMTAF